MEEISYKVNTIYPAFMGECNLYGIGVRCTFLRLNGCNIRCYVKTMGMFCDTPEALTIGEGKDMTISEIVEKVKSFDNNVVCLTGGEPLLQKPRELLEELSNSGFHVVVETNGSMPINKYKGIPNVTFVVDKKDKSTGEKHCFRKTNVEYMEDGDFLKFVVNDTDDIDEVTDFINDYKRWHEGQFPPFQISVGLFWGSDMTYRQLVDTIQERDLPVTINMQTHKLMMLYDRERKNLTDLIIPREL